MDSEINELAESIREHGILTALKVFVNEAGLFELIAGERRLRAQVLALVGLRAEQEEERVDGPAGRAQIRVVLKRDVDARCAVDDHHLLAVQVADQRHPLPGLETEVDAGEGEDGRT